MKKWFVGLLACLILILMTSCNYQVVDLPNGTIVEGKVDSWRDYEDGDQIQVTINGVTYLIHTLDAVLMTEEPE